jgi:hypothetical protein
MAARKHADSDDLEAQFRRHWMAARKDARSRDFESRFRRHFPRSSNDIAVVVLKGHLLLEESVNRLLAGLLRKPEAIEGANLRFHHKLCLIQALLAPMPTHSILSDLMEAAEKLNTLRNRLALHLDHPQIEALVSDLASLCEALQKVDDPKMKAEPIIRRLMRAIGLLCGVFEGVSRVAEKYGPEVK